MPHLLTFNRLRFETVAMPVLFLLILAAIAGLTAGLIVWRHRAR